MQIEELYNFLITYFWLLIFLKITQPNEILCKSKFL